LASRNNLAIALWTNGDRASALRQMQRAAERAVQVLSGTHPLA
ncbi:MAG: tetratricopeptide repeat protein, partial [Austwickia sp.]|nr:tetratricopeptide repeat protein [Austwickia sp.]